MKSLKFLPVFLTTIACLQVGCSKDPNPDNYLVSIISITPNSGPHGTIVVIRGSNFAQDPLDNITSFNNMQAEVLSASDDSLVVVAPLNGTSGPVSVSVDGQTATGNVYTYTADSVDVYAAAPAMGVVYWKNGQEVFLGATQHNFGGAYGIAVSGADLYVAGYTYFGTFPGYTAAYWKNEQKTLLSAPNTRGQVGSMVIANGDLYVGGSEGQRPVYWKNGTRNFLPGSTILGTVKAMAINGTDVHAAGYDSEGRTIYWKNGVETILGTSPLTDGGATGLAVSGSDVYVTATDSGNAVYWKNGTRVTLQRHANTSAAPNGIALKGNDVYVAGTSNAGEPVYWKNGVMYVLPKRGMHAMASSITIYASDVYIGGMDGTTPVYWKNGVEIVLCCRQDGPVRSMAIVRR